MTDTTQPPAETLAIIEMLQSAEVQEGATVFDHSAEEIGIAVMENHRAVLAALTRRAGGDAVPAGVSAVMGRILMHYGEDPSTLARIKGMVAQYREAPFRSADWLAGEIMRILDSEPANDITPKPPAGGDAGAVATIADLQRRRASDLDAVVNLSLCLKEARDALEWYRDTVGCCRMMHAEGDEARNALHKDCGERAEKALAFRVPAREPKHDQ